MILIFFFLAVTLYPRTTASQSNYEYDPWVDYNDDGKIDHKDLLQLAAVYGTSGTLTKNVNVANTPLDVNVTNFPLDEQGNLGVSFLKPSKVITVVKDLNMSFSEGVYEGVFYTTDPITIDGYSQQYVYLSIRNWTIGWIAVKAKIIFITDNIVYEGAESPIVTAGSAYPYNAPSNNTVPYETWGPIIRIRIQAYTQAPFPAGWVLVSISLYLRN